MFNFDNFFYCTAYQHMGAQIFFSIPKNNWTFQIVK